MNDRIRKLLKQAEERYPRHLAVAVPEVQLRQDALDKFAELIVQECVQVAYEYDAPKMSGPGMIIAGKIEDNFGIQPEGFCSCCGARTEYQECDDSCVWRKNERTNS